jgi:hypothetical protein
LQWSGNDVWTIGDAVTGTAVFGATGSGKSSGSGEALAMAMLRHGFGGLILCTKPSERSEWENYCRAAKRQGDLRILGAGGALRFNFLNYEASRSGEGAGLTENIVNLFSTVMEVAERGSGGGEGRDDGTYWKRATKQLLRNAVDLLLLAGKPVSVPDLYRVVISAPTSAAQKRSAEWQAQSLCFQALSTADKRERSARQQADLEVVADYWLCEFPELADKTRSVVISTFTSMADVLMRGILRELYCTETNITPEAVSEGAIILLDLPVKTYADVGTIAQVLFKYAFQRAIERRDVRRTPRPAFLWADEAQNFVTSYDASFQQTCRSARVATVYLTQNLSNMHAALGGQEKGKAEAASVLGNLTLKVIHANGDPGTNEWAASLIGRSRQFLANGNTSRSGDSGWPLSLGIEALSQPTTTSAGFSEAWEYEVQPAAFTRLKTGGPANGWEVEAVLFQNGKRFQGTGKTWMPVTFKQRH